MGSGREENTRRSISSTSQRGAVQDFGQTLAVSFFSVPSSSSSSSCRRRFSIKDPSFVGSRNSSTNESKRGNGPRDHLLPLSIFTTRFGERPFFFFLSFFLFSFYGRVARMPNTFLPRGAEAARGTTVLPLTTAQTSTLLSENRTSTRRSVPPTPSPLPRPKFFVSKLLLTPR